MTDQQEVERKYDVAPGAAVPDLPGAGEPVEHHLEATYFDTRDLRLQSARITLRRRTGGDDEGWHLKLPGEGDARVEVHAPLADEVPEALLARVRAHVRDREVVPVARLVTHRVVRRLVEDGAVLAEACDDRVRAEALPLAEGEGVTADEWREWEVELVAGDRALLDALDPALRAAGATPATRASKVQRVLAGRLRPDWRRHARTEPATLGEAFLAHLAGQLDRLLEQDRAFRAGDVDEPVHQMRVAARRLRSGLATFRPLITEDHIAHVQDLRDELRWLGTSLAEARDLTVLRGRLDARLDDGDPTSVATRRHVDSVLDQTRRAALDHAAGALRDPRYLRLLDTLEALLVDAPLTPKADRSARKALPRLLRRDLERLRRRVRRADRAPDPEAREHALHDVRKAAKRLRYAAEAATPVFGAKAEKLAARAEAVQEVLGEHQDTVVSRATLRDLAHHGDTAGPVGLALGRLEQLEAARAAELREQAGRVVADATRTPRWLRK